MREIAVSKVKSQGGSWRIVLTEDGQTRDSWQGRFGGDRSLQPVADALGVKRHWLRTCIDQGEGTYALPEALVEAPVEAVVRVRGINETEDRARDYPDIDAALADATITVPEPLIYWEGTKHLCAVDADFHTMPYDQRPSADSLRGRYQAISPVPPYAWVTHGRGLRLVYKSIGEYHADELAAVGAVRLTQLEPLASIEIKSVTRHPAYPNGLGRACSGVDRRQPTTDCRAVSGWFESRSDADGEDVREWLENSGYEVGQRYEHHRCPVDPHVQSHGTPVVVYENGIFCHGCAGHGVRRGARAPGWFPYSVFVGTPSVSVVSRCVDSLTHWEHARHVLAAHHPLPEPVLRGAYACMLKQRHGRDPRIPAVFTAGQDVVRFAGYWGTLAGESFTTTRCDAIVSKFPTCQYIDGKKVKVDGERVARLLMTTSLERYGYPALRPVWGLPIYSQHLEPRYPYEITMHKGDGELPRYVLKEQRISEDEAWGRLEVAFPGVCRRAVQLLIAAKGAAEGDGTFPPFLFITGPTSSAKSTTVVVAAAIAGDRVLSIPSINDDQRIRASIMEAKSKGTYAVFNEAMKSNARTKWQSKAESMEFALGLTPDSVSHKLWTGPVEMGSLPVCVWTDVCIPQEVKQHAQLARRFIHIHLPRYVDWHASMRETGIGRAEWLRLAGRHYVEAADCILSSVIDEFFRAPATFAEVARALGYGTLSDSDDAKMQIEELRMFYELVQQLPDANGWKVIDMNDAGAASSLWRELADKPDLRSSQRISEVDWSKLLGRSNAIQFHVNAKGSKVRVKFEGAPDREGLHEMCAPLAPV